MTIKVVTSTDIGKGLEIVDNKLVAKGIQSIKIEGNNIVVTDRDGQESNVALPAQTVDVKLSGAEIVDETKLKLTLSDDSEIQVDLAKFLNVVPTTEEIKTALKGEEIQGLDGTSLGFLIKKD